MAIDTAEKRRSAAGRHRVPGVTPNVSKDAEWRAQAGRNYSGIAFTAPSDEEPIDCYFNFPCETICRLSPISAFAGLGPAGIGTANAKASRSIAAQDGLGTAGNKTGRSKRI